MQKEDVNVAAYQLNSIVGDFAGNSQKILKAITEAEKQGVTILVFPELALCGYLPFDLFDYAGFAEQEYSYLEQIARQVPSSMAVVIGTFAEAPYHSALGRYYNQAALLSGGTVLFRQNKSILANNDVFFEPRYFQPAEKTAVFNWNGLNLGLILCEDAWHEELLGSSSPSNKLIAEGADIIISLNASPYGYGKQQTRHRIACSISAAGVPFVYANAVGGRSELIYDGRSVLMRADGSFCYGPASTEALVSYHPFGSEELTNDSVNEEEDLLQALLLGLRDYTRVNGFESCHLGLSGGIDSALVAALAVMALGKKQVKGFLMPSRYSSDGSIDHSLTLASSLGMETTTIPIEQPHQCISTVLSDHFNMEGLADENLQARIRGLYLMAYGNSRKSLLLTTGNKSELSTGYSTLYGDMCGALNPIGDLYKTEVFRLCRYINEREGREVIPFDIINKAPSAELRPDQTDQQSLPPYDVLDAVLKGFIEDNRSEASLAKEFGNELVGKVLRLFAGSEFKRYQSPPILKVSKKSLGAGRLIPLSRHWFELS